jgi:RimJ/RimL family protein N-acetyltransferase
MHVLLRQVTADDLPVLDAWRGDPDAEGEFNDFGLAPSRSTVDGNHLVVEADGHPIGTVSWQEVRYGPNDESRAVNIGIALIPEARGKGHGAVAQRMLARYLFATTPVNRVEASTDVDNLAEQKSLERAGFTREGVIRGAQFRAGAWHDLIGYSCLRDEVSAQLSEPGASDGERESDN